MLTVTPEFLVERLTLFVAVVGGVLVCEVVWEPGEGRHAVLVVLGI